MSGSLVDTYYDSVAKKLNDIAATAVDQGRRKVLKSGWASCNVVHFQKYWLLRDA